MPGYVKKAQKQICHKMKKTAAFPAPMCNNKVRCHHTICKNGINSTTVRRTRETLHPTVMRKVPLPRQGSQQHSIMPNQCTGGTILQSHWRHNMKRHTTTWLPWHARRRSFNFQCKRHDTSSAQWRKLSQRTQSTQQSRWTLLPIKWHTTTIE